MPNRLTDAERSEFLAAHPDWTLEGETITRTFVLGDFKEAMGFTTMVALAAEVMDHHPDIDIRYSKVTLALTTHDAGGLTALDFNLAEKAGA